MGEKYKLINEKYNINTRTENKTFLVFITKADQNEGFDDDNNGSITKYFNFYFLPVQQYRLLQVLAYYNHNLLNLSSLWRPPLKL